MYNAYFVNTMTGELIQTSDPKDNPSGIYWKECTVSEWVLYVTIYLKGYHDNDPK